MGLQQIAGAPGGLGAGGSGPSKRAADTIKSFLSPSERRNVEILMFRFLTKLQEIKI